MYVIKSSDEIIFTISFSSDVLEILSSFPSLDIAEPIKLHNFHSHTINILINLIKNKNRDDKIETLLVIGCSAICSIVGYIYISRIVFKLF